MTSHAIETKFLLKGSQIPEAVRREQRISDTYTIVRPDLDVFLNIAERLKVPENTLINVTWEEAEASYYKVKLSISKKEANGSFSKVDLGESKAAFEASLLKELQRFAVLKQKTRVEQVPLWALKLCHEKNQRIRKLTKSKSKLIKINFTYNEEVL